MNHYQWDTKNKLLTALIAVIFALSPFLSRGVGDTAKEFAAATNNDVLNPSEWLDALKKNLTIPKLTPPSSTSSSAGDLLKESAPTLQKINADLKEEVGIDFSKFFSWVAKMLKIAFEYLIAVLENISKALNPK